MCNKSVQYIRFRLTKKEIKFCIIFLPVHVNIKPKNHNSTHTLNFVSLAWLRCVKTEKHMKLVEQHKINDLRLRESKRLLCHFFLGVVSHDMFGERHSLYLRLTLLPCLNKSQGKKEKGPNSHIYGKLFSGSKKHFLHPPCKTNSPQEASPSKHRCPPAH